jgi:hypothetical protein
MRSVKTFAYCRFVTAVPKGRLVLMGEEKSAVDPVAAGYAQNTMMGSPVAGLDASMGNDENGFSCCRAPVRPFRTVLPQSKASH